MRTPPSTGGQAPPFRRTLAPYAVRGNRVAATARSTAAQPRGAPMEFESAAIREIDYDPEREKLIVRFTSGERYLYVGVPGEVCRSFVDADSKGRFFHAEIRDRYPFNRLDD